MDCRGVPSWEATAAVQAGVMGWAGTLALGGGAHLEGVLEIEMTTTVRRWEGKTF